MVSISALSDGMRVQAMVRYRDEAAPATVFLNHDSIRIVFDERSGQ